MNPCEGKILNPCERKNPHCPYKVTMRILFWFIFKLAHAKHWLGAFLLLVGWLEVGVDVLHVIEVLKLLNHLLDGLALVGRYVGEVVGDVGELG